MVLTLKEFIKKYEGVPNVGNTPGNKGECVGLVMLWVDNLGLPNLWSHAKDIFNNASINDYKKIKNSASEYPNAGDIITWGAPAGGGYGHTAIVVSSNKSEDSFTVFEQNNPGNIPGTDPEITKYKKWTNVIGWLRPLILEEQDELEAMRISRNAWKKACGDFEKELIVANKLGGTLLNQVDALQTELFRFNKDVTEFSLLGKRIEVRITPVEEVPKGGVNIA